MKIFKACLLVSLVLGLNASSSFSESSGEEAFVSFAKCKLETRSTKVPTRLEVYYSTRDGARGMLTIGMPRVEGQVLRPKVLIPAQLSSNEEGDRLRVKSLLFPRFRLEQGETKIKVRYKNKKLIYSCYANLER